MIPATNDSYLELSTMRNVLHTLIQISVPYIFIVSVIGIGGNFLTIVMLARKSLSKNFNNCTLIALALTDLLFNFTLVSRCVSDLTNSSGPQLCRVLSFLSHLAELLSACFTAHFTAQRFIAVRFPLSVFVEKKIHLIHYLIVLLFIIFGTFYCLALVRYNSYDVCHEELFLKWFLSDALLSFLLPFAIITVLNILIVCHLKKGFHFNHQFRFARRHQHSSETLPLNCRTATLSSFELPLRNNSQGKAERSGSNENSRSSVSAKKTSIDAFSLNGRVRSIDLIHRSPAVHSKSQSYRVTRMLIVVSTCFLLLNAPAHICTIGLKIYTIKNTISIENFYETPSSAQNLNQQNQTLLALVTNLDLISRKAADRNETSTYDNNMRWAEFSYIVVVITQHISFASYSINFFLYSFCGMKFRRELSRCLSQQRQQRTISQLNTVQNTS